ncbi:MAG TPA: hypothetical protein VK700_09570 [Steroidobacteraceae bacterium]|jgi:hypothetical protein|nr:hypothetical protein [Steroidobacteraceae bacterium]
MNDPASLLRRMAAALALAAALLGNTAAHAGQIFSDSHLIQGTSVISSVSYAFNVSGPGVLTVDLDDLTWPTKLTDLSFTATTSSTVIGQLNGAGQESFDLTSGGTIYAYVTGEATNAATGPNYGVGLYTLAVGFTPAPVPLPASVALLLAALLGLALLQLRFRQDYRFLSAPPQSA